MLRGLMMMVVVMIISLHSTLQQGSKLTNNQFALFHCSFFFLFYILALGSFFQFLFHLVLNLTN